MERPPVHQYAVQILTSSFQLNGELEVVGDLMGFLIGPTRDAFPLRQAHLAPIGPGSSLRPMDLPQISVRRREVVFLHLADPAAKESMRLMSRADPLILYTPLAIIRGNVHVSAETRLDDFMSTMTHPLIALTEARLFMLTQAGSGFPAECDMLLVGRPYVQMYYSP